ncbi:MAG: phosphatidate cytidylyltransferase [Thermoflexales bacterium]
MSSELVARVLSGIVVVALTLGTGYLGGWWFVALLLSALVLATRELWRLLRAAGYHPDLGFMMLTITAAFISVRFSDLQLLAPALSLALLSSLAWQLYRADHRTIGDWAVGFAGGFYLGWTAGHLAGLRELEDGWWWLVLTLGSVWTADSAAFVVGRLLGRRWLAPRISPAKTWEGYWGGSVCSALVGLAVGAGSPISWPVGLLCGALIGSLSVFGDLIESMLKRQAHAKDSGHLIPGHGGVLDRIDSVLWAGVIAFYVQKFVG